MGQKKVSDVLELEVQTAVSCPVGVGSSEPLTSVHPPHTHMSFGGVVMVVLG